MIPRESFDRNGDPYTCKVNVYRQKDDNEEVIAITPRRANGYLSALLQNVKEEDMIEL